MKSAADSPLLPAAPTAAARVFGRQRDAAVRYAELLATRGIAEGLLGPREAPSIWRRHLLNCVAIAPLVPAGSSLIDIGSGAGLPGIPLALARPDLTVVLLEPMARRARFLRECLAELGISGVCVVASRAQDASGYRGWAGIATARAVAPLSRLIPMALPLLRPDGDLIALKGERAPDDITQARRDGVTAQMELVVVRGDGGPATVVRVRPGATERGSS